MADDEDSQNQEKPILILKAARQNPPSSAGEAEKALERMRETTKKLGERSEALMKSILADSESGNSITDRLEARFQRQAEQETAWKAEILSQLKLHTEATIRISEHLGQIVKLLGRDITLIRRKTKARGVQKPKAVGRTAKR